MEFGNEDDMDNDDNGLEDVERFVVSLLYNHKPLGDPIDYEEFESNSEDEDGGSKDGGERNNRRSRNDELAGFQVPGGCYTNGPSYQTWHLPHKTK